MAEMLDRYELREVLGTGAFATVWRAHDPMLGTDVAIKLLADNWARDPEMRQRFLTEARLAMEATSPHLVRVHHVAESADRNIPYIVMALADGGTLEARLRAQRLHPPSHRQALELTREIASSVAALHDIGLLHRDLKPANVLFHTAQGRERPILGDFGLARNIDRSALTLVGGTPTYAAPEQAAGLTQLTKQADLFPLGVMFLEMITGDVPHHATMVDAATSSVDVSAFLAKHGIALATDTHELITSLLDPIPGNRPADAHELIEQIDSVLQSELPGQTPPRDAPPNPSLETEVGGPAFVGDGPLPSSRGMLIGLIAMMLVPAVIIGGLVVANLGADPEAGPTTTTTVAPASTSSAAASENAGPEPTNAVETADSTSDNTAASENTAASGNTAASENPAVSDNSARIPEDFPVPQGAVLDRRETVDGLMQVFNIAGSPDNLVVMYSSFDGWRVVSSSQAGETMSLVVSDGTDNVSVVGAPVENTAGVEITKLTVTPTGALEG